MDAQAQDRAHRIGQTREVHIYRMVTSHTIEENILLKAQQKRNLDVLVMDRGKFDSSLMSSHRKEGKVHSEEAFLTAGNLHEILGIPCQDRQEVSGSQTRMEATMSSLEDADDVIALEGAKREAAKALEEFDESISYTQDSKDVIEENSNTGIDNGHRKELTAEQQLQQELVAWQEKIGKGAASIESSLAPVERYGLQFRTVVDPFVSIFAVMEYNRKLELENDDSHALDVDEIEREKSTEERKAMEDGDLLATMPTPDDILRQKALYQSERRRLRANTLHRRLTGDNWQQRLDNASKLLFWFNVDTGEAVWEKPKVLQRLEEYERAIQKRWAALPKHALVVVMSFLTPMPDRMTCSGACRAWAKAATDESFVRHVYPVEMGAYTREDSQLHYNHYRTISDAIAASQPGDTIGKTCR